VFSLIFMGHQNVYIFLSRVLLMFGLFSLYITLLSDGVSARSRPNWWTHLDKSKFQHHFAGICLDRTVSRHLHSGSALLTESVEYRNLPTVNFTFFGDFASRKICLSLISQATGEFA
jgi:hypothetical protein